LDDPAVQALSLAVVVNVLIRLMQTIMPTPWDPAIDGILTLWTVWCVLAAMTGSHPW
jgi:hypothetical protein